ncbi:MAG: YgiT-type zinc finger protein [candidate division KSB1 bacterium]|nr:YgiT-type zinc finger protein [candidate division KSB1 bacterium]
MKILKGGDKFMKCAACHGQMVEKMGEIDLRINGKLYIVRNITYEECLSCGERVLTPALSQALYDKIKQREYTEETFKIPVLEGTLS